MKTIIIKGVEYETETHDFDKTLSEIKIPKGWRLWTVQECTALHNNVSHRKQLNLKVCFFFIKQPILLNINKYVARFIADSDWADLGCVRLPQNHGAELGVRFAREVKK